MGGNKGKQALTDFVYGHVHKVRNLKFGSYSLINNCTCLLSYTYIEDLGDLATVLKTKENAI